MKMDLKQRFADIVGDSYVSDGLAELYVYSFDMTENPPQRPRLVVMPSCVHEIQKIVQLANDTLTPLIPFVTGQSVGGLTIPQVEGAVIVDLKRMDRIIEVDEDAMYMLVEPGVTFGHVKQHLDKHHPVLRYTYPLAPPYTSVMVNALLQGLCDLSTTHGSMSDFINGLEAILPTGEIVRVGSGIMGDENWFGRYPLPDLVGLFSGWQGMTGIVTKISLKLWPKKKSVGHAALFTFGEESTTSLLKAITKSHAVEDTDCMSLSLVKMLMGIPPMVQRFEGEPDYGTVIILSANSDVELIEKKKQLESIVRQSQETEPRNLLIDWETVSKLMGIQAKEWIDFPSDAFKVLTEYDGLTWVGTYIHPKHWATALSGGRKIIEKYGFELMAFLKPMHMLHFAEFKFIIRFPKDPQTIERVRQCNEELLDLALSLKAIPYKTPIWSAKKLKKLADPSFFELARRIKQMLDPNNIMNPGRLDM
ncbi:FAD-binding oxidoreductase [Candidatus Thorarchaeota archaeon]|nr:MAG: FAD-binding oxidoreductase [Candidatus Thorarchaeota archaeon]